MRKSINFNMEINLTLREVNWTTLLGPDCFLPYQAEFRTNGFWNFQQLDIYNVMTNVFSSDREISILNVWTNIFLYSLKLCIFFTQWLWCESVISDSQNMYLWIKWIFRNGQLGLNGDPKRRLSDHCWRWNIWRIYLQILIIRFSLGNFPSRTLLLVLTPTFT